MSARHDLARRRATMQAGALEPGRDATGIRPVPAFIATAFGGEVERAVAWALPSAVRARLTIGGRSLVFDLRERDDRTFECVPIPGGAPVPKVDSTAAAELCARVRWLSAEALGASESVSYAPSARERSAVALGASLGRLRSPSDAAGVRIDLRDADASLRAIGHYVDVVAARWGDVFALADAQTEMPAWLGSIILGLSGDLAGVRRLLDGAQTDDGTLAIPRGAALGHLGLFEAARDAYEHGVRSVMGADRADVYLELADVHHALSRDGEAIAWTRRALLSRANDDDLLHRVCGRFVRWGALDDAHVVLGERCTREPPDRRAFLGLGELLLWAGRSAEARPWIERARAMTAVEDADLLRAEGILLSIEQRWAEAIAPFTRALAQRPRSSELSTWLSEVHLRAGDRDEAKRHLAEARAIANSPIHGVLHALLSGSSDLAHDRDLAIVATHLGEPLASPPIALLSRFLGNRTSLLTVGAAAATHALGIAVVRLPSDDLTTSRAASATLLKRVGTLPDVELDRRFEELARRYDASPHPFCYWGELCLWRGEHARATTLFDRALERGPARWAYVGKAAVLILTGEPAAADAQFAECAREFEPVVGATMDVYRGEAQRHRGDHASACALLSEAVRVKPGRVGAWMNLALARHALGSFGEAERIFTMLTARWPRLYWDASAAIHEAPSWPPKVEHMPELFEAALRLMRGNRSSHTITYFDRHGVLRVAQDAEWWRVTLAGYARFLATDLRDKVAGGLFAG